MNKRGDVLWRKDKVGSWEANQHGDRAPSLGSAPARLLRLLRARLAAPGSSALPGRGRPTGRPATASAARARRLHKSGRSRRVWRHPGDLPAGFHTAHLPGSVVSAVSWRRLPHHAPTQVGAVVRV